MDYNRFKEALENLKNCQKQLDADGCQVGVSRQALEEVIKYIEANNFCKC